MTAPVIQTGATRAVPTSRRRPGTFTVPPLFSPVVGDAGRFRTAAGGQVRRPEKNGPGEASPAEVSRGGSPQQVVSTPRSGSPFQLRSRRPVLEGKGSGGTRLRGIDRGRSPGVIAQGLGGERRLPQYPRGLAQLRAKNNGHGDASRAG